MDSSFDTSTVISTPWIQPNSTYNEVWTSQTPGNSTWDEIGLSTVKPTDDPFAESPALYYFRRIVPGILLCIGFPGNLLSMAVMLRKFFRSTSAGLYLFVLLVADTCFLFSNYSFIFWLINNFKTFELVHNTVSCKLWVYISESSGYVSSWTLVALSIERAIVVCKPHRSSVVCSRKRAAIIIGAIVSVMMLLNSYIPITFESIRNTNNNPSRPTRSCFLKKPYSGYFWMIAVHYLMPFLVYCFLPACCILVANVVVVCQMRRRSKITSTLAKSREAETNKVTYLLVASSVFFLISTFPMTTFLFLQNVLKVLRMDTPLLHEIYRYVMVLMPLNQSFNFIIYCISGSSFRRELKAMIGDCVKYLSCPRCTCCRRNGFNLPAVNGNYWCKVQHASVDRTTSTGSSILENTHL